MGILMPGLGWSDLTSSQEFVLIIQTISFLKIAYIRDVTRGLNYEIHKYVIIGS